MYYSFNYPEQNGLPPEFLSKKQATNIYSRIGFAFVALVLLYNGIAFGLAYFLYYNFPDLYFNEIVQSLFSFVPLYFIAVPVFTLIISKLPKTEPEKSRYPALKFLKIFAICYGLTFIGSLLSNLFIYFFSLLSGNELSDPTSYILESNWVINLIFVAILAPVLEELVFRKLLCNRLLFLGEKQAVIISALSFGLLHGNFQQVIYATLIGIVLGLVYLRSGNIKITIAYHMILNLMGSIIVPYIYNATTEGADTESAGYIIATLFAGFFSLFLFVLLSGGIILFIITAIRFRFRKGMLVIEQNAAALITSPGIWLGFAAFMSLFVLQLIGL